MSLKELGFKVAHIDCECGSACHTVRFVTDIDNNHKFEPTVSLDVQLRHHKGFWKRLKAAFLYLIKDRDADWDSFILGHDTIEQVEQVVREYKLYYDKYRKQTLGVCPSCDNRGGISSCNECGKCASCGKINEHSENCSLYQDGWLKPSLKGWTDKGI